MRLRTPRLRLALLALALTLLGGSVTLSACGQNYTAPRE